MINIWNRKEIFVGFSVKNLIKNDLLSRNKFNININYQSHTSQTGGYGYELGRYEVFWCILYLCA